MELTFYGGLDTIGGTIIRVSSGKSQLIFDFGLVYHAERSLLECHLMSDRYPLLDLLRLRRMPAFDGFYNRAALYGEKTPAARTRFPRPYDPIHDASQSLHVFISHLHLDHMAGVGWIDPHIPVVMSEPSYRLMEALKTIGETVGLPRPYRGIPYDTWQHVGEIRYQAVAVDHDIPGASALWIEAEGIRIIYSGDLRWHGKHPERIDEFIQKAHAFSPDLLLIEGTTIVGRDVLPEEQLIPSSALPPGFLTEKDMPEHLARSFHDARGMIIVNPYHRNIDRLEAILDASQQTGRTLVLEPETAYLFYQMSDRLQKDPKQNAIALYLSERSLQRTDRGHLEHRAHENRDWLDTLRSIYPVVDEQALRDDPQAYVVQNSWERLWDLLDWNLDSAVYVQTNGMPLGAFDPQFAYLKKVLKELGIEHRSVGTSGHALPQHLLEIIRRIEPAYTVPIHSLFPERLGAHAPRPFFPKKHVTYTLKHAPDGTLKITT
ncbi:MAG: hypothetical protein IMX04_06955 [Candidatus Carbobacillus altaicus]|nr:hypothetical protein [Candidatus Carbobacillus altaicus]